MNIIFVLLFFLLSSNAILALFIQIGFRKKIEDPLLVFFSYGIGPFIFGLIFYALIFIFPERDNYFYSLIISSVFILIFVLCGKTRNEIKSIHSNVVSKVFGIIKKQPNVAMIVAIFFIGLYTLQLIGFPIVDNDSALYLDQTEAFYEYKNLDWQKKSEVIINNNDTYTYNSSIRPGIPSLLATTYLFQGSGRHDLISLRFLTLYYYFLLLILFLFSIKKASEKLSFNSKRNLTYGLLFFVFSWSITRSFIFSGKEIIIYFFALFSILIATSLLKKNNNDWQNRILLGILLGINTFVNLHGIIIECIILFLLVLFAKKKIIERIFDVISIFLLSVPFGGFEFIIFYGFIFSEPIKGIIEYTTGLNNPSISPDNVDIAVHEELYQTKDILSEYLKGKLQILTNIGYFGFFFWLYLLITAKYFKKIIEVNFLKIIIAFIVLYYLIVIDPFSLNKHPLTIVLWGSPKYAMLLLFLSMIVVSVYIDTLIVWTAGFFEENILKLFAIGTILLAVLLIFYSTVISLGTRMLLLTIPVFKDVSFYRGAVEKFYFLLAALLIFFLVALIASMKNMNKKVVYYFVNIIIAFIVLVPFFMTNVGKVSFTNSFVYLMKNEKTKIEIINFNLTGISHETK